MSAAAYTPDPAPISVEGGHDPDQGAIVAMQNMKNYLQRRWLVTPGGETRELTDFPILFGLYQGKSFFSRAIQLRTWSKYSHVSAIHPCGVVVEAWPSSGRVRCVSNPDVGHSPGTPIDCFAWPGLTAVEVDALRGFYWRQVGKNYDYLGVLGFVRRKYMGMPGQENAAWFCSELIFAGSLAIGKPLLNRIPSWKVYPGMIEMSPRLEYVGQIITGGAS
ncbi:MAG: hypothetical protein V1929_00265 [bacterium]